MMKLDYLPPQDDLPDAPMLRLYGDDPQTARAVQEAVAMLACGKAESVSLEALPGVRPLDGCVVAAKVGENDAGIRPLCGRSFEWVLCRSSWYEVMEMISPFTRGHRAHCWNWLEHDSRRWNRLEQEPRIWFLLSTHPKGLW